MNIKLEDWQRNNVDVLNTIELYTHYLSFQIK